VLAQVLAAPDKIGSFQGKAGPFLHDPQPFSSAIQVGVDQALNRGLVCRGMGHGLERAQKKGSDPNRRNWLGLAMKR
jgi:hypothetical protein